MICFIVCFCPVRTVVLFVLIAFDAASDFVVFLLIVGVLFNVMVKRPGAVCFCY